MKFNNKASYRSNRPPYSRLKRVGLVFLIILLIIIGGVAAWKLKQVHDIAVERARFAQADKDISQLTGELTAKLGPPINSTYQHICDKPSAEWTDVPLFCSIDSTIYYKIDGANKANQAFGLVHDLVKQEVNGSLQVSGGNNDSGQFDELSNGASQTAYITYYNASIKMKCYATGIYYDGLKPPYPDLLKLNQLIINISFDCGDHAITNYFK